MTHPELILASTSPFRKALLQRLHIPFRTAAPQVDESPHEHETAAQMARRLAAAKAAAVSHLHPEALVIGSDQVPECDGKRLRKPESPAAAHQQLRCCSGRRVDFHTAVSIWRRGQARHAELVTTRVTFRALTDEQISRYVAADEPLHSAGAFKAESLGISLCEKITSTDPTALIGLPLIAVTTFLNREGIAVP